MSKRTTTCPLIVEYDNATFGWFPVSFERNARLAKKKVKDWKKYRPEEVRIRLNPDFKPHNLFPTDIGEFHDHKINGGLLCDYPPGDNK